MTRTSLRNTSSFNKTILPQSVKVEYLHCQVRPYIPKPRCCFKCQRFGHNSQTCRGKPTCPKCAESERTSNQHCYKVCCVNCNGSHPSHSRSCPHWQEEKETAKEYITSNEARKLVSFMRRGTFAEAARRGLRRLRHPPVSAF